MAEYIALPLAAGIIAALFILVAFLDRKFKDNDDD
jgi:hypothetical protein|tara:strand:- start:53 stop:157 length:105 start_codon:yes stop_codon:yes gene_type:complete